MIVMIYTVDIGITMGICRIFFYAFFLFSFLKLLFPFGFYIPGTLFVLGKELLATNEEEAAPGSLAKGGNC